MKIEERVVHEVGDCKIVGFLKKIVVPKQKADPEKMATEVMVKIEEKRREADLM